MKVINPECLCRNCKHQLNCKNHKVCIRLQILTSELGEDWSVILIRTEECKKFERY